MTDLQGLTTRAIDISQIRVAQLSSKTYAASSKSDLRDKGLDFDQQRL